MYPALLLLGAHLWLVFHWTERLGSVELLSFTVQQIALVLAYMLISSRLRRGWTRFLWASCAALYIAFIFLDALLIDVVGVSAYRAITMLVAGGSSSLAEIGLRPGRLAVILLGFALACTAGGLLHRMLDRWPVAPRFHAFGPGSTATLVFVVLAFSGEQMLSREGGRYLHRAMDLPGYVQIFRTAKRSYDLQLPDPASLQERDAALGAIGRARNPRHVLFVVLESVRADAIDPKISPALDRLAREGLRFTSAYSEAIFTPLSWNVLLLDRPPHMFVWPLTMMAPRGSWPLRVLRRAGYRTWISTSADLSYGHFLPFLVGDDQPIEKLYMVGEPELARWQRDDRATKELTSWIESATFDQPTFMLLQLDSTHWTYDFPPGQAVVEPFSPPLTSPVPLSTPEEFRLLHNRYLNCVHRVDLEVGRAVEALRRRGILEDTAIVVTSDHGEGFSPGMQGHAAITEATTQVPMIMRLPGVEPRSIEAPVSSRALLSTLFDYLEIEGLGAEMMLGRSALPPKRVAPEILTFSADGRRADLRLADGVRIQMGVVIESDRASFTPITVIDRSGARVRNERALLASVPWQRLIEERVVGSLRQSASVQTRH